MSVNKYIPYGSTKIVINKVAYQNEGNKKALLPVDKIDKDQLEKLLKDKFIVKLEFDESEEFSDDKDAARAKKKREALVAKAKEFGITVTDEMPAEEIQQAIKKAADDKRNQE
jgi:hypothetical protein